MFRRMTRERFLSDAELEAFLASVRERRHKNQPRDYALFVLLANTGIRPSEALALTWADVTLGAEPRIRVIRLKKHKARQQFDDLPLPHPVVVALESLGLGDPSAHVFEVGKRQAERAFHYYMRRAGLYDGRWLYSLRHTAATRIYRATRDIHVVQAALGHEQPDMSCLYAHLTRSMLRTTIEGLSAAT